MTIPAPSPEELDMAEDARLLEIGDPVDGDEALLIGSLEACLAEAFSQAADARSQLCVWTSGRVYGPEDIEGLRLKLASDGSAPASL